MRRRERGRENKEGGMRGDKILQKREKRERNEGKTWRGKNNGGEKKL